MSYFGSTLFSGSPFIKWTLSPVLVLFGVLFPFLIDVETLMQVAILMAMEVACFALLAGFWLPPPQAWWVYRFVALLVFCAYAAYFVHEVFFTDDPVKILESRGEASPRNALLGLIIIGLPSLGFAVFGRFGRQITEESEGDEPSSTVE